jgi:hypothetical protein
MTSSTRNQVILAVQVGGFLFALSSLFYLHQHLTAYLFPIGFGVHLVGDLWRLSADKVI